MSRYMPIEIPSHPHTYIWIYTTSICIYILIGKLVLTRICFIASKYAHLDKNG